MSLQPSKNIFLIIKRFRCLIGKPNPKFSTPKINTANGDLTKRWYVHYSYRDPKTGNLKRMNNIYGSANSYKTKEDRLAVLSIYRKRLIKLLKEGYDRFCRI